MSTTFDLTGGPIRVTSTTKQPLAAALDLGDYREVDALLSAISLEGTAGPQAGIRLLTHLTNKGEDGWVIAVTFTTVAGSATFEMKQVTAFLKYLRWEVFSLTGTAPAITFAIGGIGKD